MSTGATTWYRSRIGEPTTTDEATGYWIFVLGFFAGVLGINLFLQSQPATSLRQWGIVFAASGLVLILVGPVIRLPLRKSATYLAYMGVLVSAIAILWFITAFPADWDPGVGNQQIMTLYSVGLIIIGIGGVFVPILTGRPSSDDQATAEEAHRAELTKVEGERDDLAAELAALRKSQARFELFEADDGEWRWRLRHRNGNVIADSGEGYTRRHNAQNGLESVRRNALGASVFLIETDDIAPEAEFEPISEIESQATFELYEDTVGEIRWRLVHDNGNILTDSGEGYVTRQGAQDSIETLKTTVPLADYLRPDPTAIEVYRDRSGEWRWRLIHENGEILADGGEGYAQRSNARRAVNRIQTGLDELDFEIYQDTGGEYRWRLRSPNNQILADSGEGYASEQGAEEAVDRVQGYLPDANVLEIGTGAIEVYEDASDEFRWRLRHRNGNILADSGQGYSDRTGAYDGIETVKRNAPGAPLEET